MRLKHICASLALALLAAGAGLAQGERRGGRFADFLQPFQEVDLTPAQQRELHDVVRSFRQSIFGEFGSREDKDKSAPDRGEREGRMSKLQREAYDKALAILTPEQRIRLMGASREMVAPLGRDSGKSLDPELYRRCGALASLAEVSSPSPFNVVDSVVKPRYEPCDDATFLRRVCVDLTGATPRVEDVLDFLEDRRTDKRARLVEELMLRPEFADYQAMRWCDVLRVKSEFPVKLWPNGAAVYYRWIREAMLTNLPYDEFARQLLTASGSSFRDPPSNFYRAVQGRDPQSFAEAVALTFLGQRIEYWPQAQLDEFADCFSCVAFKPTSEWKEEIVFWNRKVPESGKAVMPDGASIAFPPGLDPRHAMADWLVSEKNRWFVPVAVNRLMYWMLGSGVVNEPDDFRDDNPPRDPRLLGLLTEEFIKSGYDIRAFYRLLATSRTYQQENPGYSVRPLEAEILQDTFCRVFGTEVAFMSEVPEPFSYYPSRLSAVSLPDGGLTSPLLQAFGRPARDTGRESDRSREVTEEQRMFFINSTELNGWIEKSWLLRVLPLEEGMRANSLNYLWLNTLSRYPSAGELAKAEALLNEESSPGLKNLQDLLWMLINSREFSSKH